MGFPLEPISGIRNVNPGGFTAITALAVDFVLWALGTGRTAIIRKIMWHNASGGNGNLIIGELTPPAVPVWTPRLPLIFMINGFDGELTEGEIPAFIFTTNVIGRTDCLGVGVPTPVQVLIEVEEIG